MEFSTYDLYAMQLLRYFIVQHGYQIVRVQQHKDDIWLMNPKQEQYPVLRISSKSNAGTLSDTEYIRNVHRIILNLIHREGPIMIINTNPEASQVSNPILNQIKVTKEGVSDTQIMRIFPGIDRIIHDVQDEQSEFVEISKEIEEVQMHQQKATMAKAKKAALPRATFVLMGIAVLMFLATYVMTLLTQSAVLGVLSTGGYYKMNLVAAYEYYRIFIAGFVHGDVFQLLIHLFVLYSIGKVCERMYTKKQYILIFLVSMVMGNIFVYIGAGNVLSFGMSAGIIGLLMAYLVTLAENGSWRLPMVRVSMMKIIWYGILMLLVSGVPLIGILGGAISGLFMGILCSGGKRHQELKKNVKIAGGILMACVLYLCTMANHVQPLQKTVDERYVDVFRHTPLNAYADYLQSCYERQYGKE